MSKSTVTYVGIGVDDSGNIQYTELGPSLLGKVQLAYGLFTDVMNQYLASLAQPAVAPKQ